MYRALLKLEDIKENETLIVYNHTTKDGIHKYFCKRCGCTDITVNDKFCPTCGCKIV